MNPPLLMLKFLKEKGLLTEDADCYSLSTVPLDVAEAAAKIFLADFNSRMEKLDLTKKKRVKFIMEFTAVAFGFEIQEHAHIYTATKIYESWLKNLAMFGNAKRQNKFIKRMFKHMTQPFAFRAAMSKETFETKFYPILLEILQIYDEFATTSGSVLDDGNWEVLFKCILGITNSIVTYDYSGVMRDELQANLRQKAINIFFHICTIAGTTKSEIWSLFTEYCRNWSVNSDFIHVWGSYLRKLTNVVFSRVLKFQNDEKIEGGAYSNGKEIDSKTLNFLYHNVLYCINFDNTLKSPYNMYNFQLIILRILHDYSSFARKTSTFYIPRYPSKSFLQMFGPAITHVDLKLPAEYDDGLSTMLGSILLAAANLQFQPNDESRCKLLQLAYAFAKLGRPQLIASYLYHGSQVFSSWSDFLPFMSEGVLMFIPKIDYKKSGRYDTADLFHAATSMFISASEIYSRANNDFTLISNAFQKLFSETPHDSNKIALLTYATQFESINILAKIADVFAPQNVRKNTTEDSVPYYCSLITLVGTVIRYKPEYIYMVNQLRLIPQITTAVTTSDIRKLKDSDLCIASTLQFIISVIEYSNDVLNVRENVNACFEFASFVQKCLDNDKKVPVKNKRLIKSLLTTVYARINIHFPSYEVFTRVQGEICGTEADIIEKYKMVGCRRYYFTISNSLLITFLEMPNGTPPIIVLVRGPFGRIAWLIQDNFKADQEAILSTQLKPMDLKAPEPSQTEPYESAETSDSALGIPKIEISGYSESDKALNDKFVSIFTKWLSINDYGFMEKFGKENPYLRPRVVDFLLTLGILDTTNKLKVIAQRERHDVTKIIKAFDKLDSIPKVPVQISHITLNDKELPNGPIRNSEKMAQFMSNLGETMKIDGKYIVTMPISAGYAKFVDSENDFSVRLVFNESGYDFVVPSQRKQLVTIAPIGNGFYRVGEKSPSREGVSPFSKGFEFIVSMKTLRFMLAANIDSCVKYIGKFEVYEVCSKRREIFKSLTDAKAQDDLAALSTLEFKVV